MTPATDLAEGMRSLKRLLLDMRDVSIDLNEAETRHRFIDRFLHECLGWQHNEMNLERRFDGTYSDYELGLPPRIILEAKRAGITFKIPAQHGTSIVRSIQSLIHASKDFQAAFQQTQGYCATRGVPVGIVCNASQIIIFIAVRNDGTPPINGRCLLFSDWVDIENNFHKLWQALSPYSQEQDRLLLELTTEQPTGVPAKLSTQLHNYPSFRYPSSSQQSLRTLSDLLIEDAPNTPAIQKRFFEECYCESGALAQEALVGKNILSARYAAMFSPSVENPTLESINPRKGSSSGISSEVIAEALGRRPIVIIGDVGVGKTSFIRNLIHIKAAEEFKNSIFLYIDLGTQANLGQNLRSIFISEIERQLFSEYQIDLDDDTFVRGVYFGDLKRFDSGIYSRIKESNPLVFLEKQIDYLATLTQDRAMHTQKAIKHLARGRRKQIVISIDNADQRKLEDQQDAFLASQELAKNWEAIVFISLRPQTYFTSKTSGSISAYPQRILTVSPPRVDLVLQKRLQFSLDLAEGRLPLDRLEGISIRLDSISSFFKALLLSLRVNKEIIELLTNITGGNIREVLELIKKFIGSSNVDSEKIIAIYEREGKYVIPLHEFSKAALLGEYSHYHAPSSIALNLFDVRYPDTKEHFLAPIILTFLGVDGAQRNKEGFVQTSNLISQCQSMGFVAEQIETSLRRMTNKKLIETTERITFNEGLQGLIGDMPLAFRVTTIGSYHTKRWMPTFAYLDAMLFDTPIFDSVTRSSLTNGIESHDIRERYRRTTMFVKYLDDCWINFPEKPDYFDWPTFKPIGIASFESVKKATQGNG